MRALGLLVTALVLCGCAGISAEDRATLRKVSVAPVTLPAKPSVTRAGSVATGLLTGPVGFLLYNAGNDYPTALKNHLAASKIDLAAIIANETYAQLKRKGVAAAPDPNRADAVMKISVGYYGLEAPGVFAIDRVAVVSLYLELVRSDGDVIWKGNYLSNTDTEITDQLEKRPLDDYFTDRALLDKSFKRVTQLTLTKILSDL